MRIEPLGYGYGAGYGELVLTDYRKGFLTKQISSFKSFDNRPVYYIDNIPCIFLSILNNVAKVLVIQDDYSTKKMYIAKSGSLFAHGDTKDGVLKSVNDKHLASLSFDQKKQEFVRLFKRDAKYSNKLFFEWHYFLTGSCERGRLMFIKSHSIDLDGEMSTYKFLSITKNEYNGHIMNDILELI